jgi:hypothetical protein
MAQNKTAAAKRKMVSAVFRNRAHSEEAFDYLYGLGFTDSEINVLMSDQTRARYYPAGKDDNKHEAGNLATEGMGVGGAVGTAVGASIAAIIAIGTTVAIPGLGLVVAGPLVAALAGGGAGAVTGGLVGTLIGAGMTEQNASAYEAALREGGIAIGVHPRTDDQADDIKERFEELGGENVCYC